MKHVLLGGCQHEVKVTRIKGVGYGVRVYVNGQLNQEGIAESRKDISRVAHAMLRMEDKCGNISDYAGRARFRYWEKLERDRYDKSSACKTE